jgi:hypothetical protein
VTVRRAALAGLLAFLPGASAAQWGGYASVGARYGTALVSDSIVRPLDVRQSVAPVLALVHHAVRRDMVGGGGARRHLHRHPAGRDRRRRRPG